MPQHYLEWWLHKKKKKKPNMNIEISKILNFAKAILDRAQQDTSFIGQI